MHIWFIMDGNRRWATWKWMLKILWHTAGWDNIENVLELCLDRNIEFISMWALAKKNIEERSEEELNHLYSLIEQKIPSLLPKLIKKWIRFETIWDLGMIPNKTKEILEDSKRKTQWLTNMTFILAIWYWWQKEIVDWIKNYIRSNIDRLSSSELDETLNKLNESEFLNYLDSWRFPAPDLIVRTWWDIRTSWYYLYQSEYSEYHFTDTFWPDFNKKDFDEAFAKFDNSKRNFWK